MEQSERVEKEAREARARWGGDKYMPWETLPGTTRDEWLAAVRPLVERIAELETELAERVEHLRAAVERASVFMGRRNEEEARAVDAERALSNARDELTIEHQARRTAADLASRQTDRINALERLSAEHVARVYELQAEVDRQAELGATFQERAERAEEAHRLALTEAADERALKARYGVALEQAETKRRAAEALVERLRGAMRGMAVEWARDIARDERRVCGVGS